MATKKKKTNRMRRDDAIDALMDDGEDRLQKLLERVGQKHENGGIFVDAEHHKNTQMCMTALTEEELNGDDEEA